MPLYDCETGLLAALAGLNSGNTNALGNNNASAASGLNSNSNSAGTKPDGLSH